MRTYYIFNVNKYYNYMYKDKPFKMYKIFEEIYYSKDYDSIKTYHVLEEIANPFNKIMLNEYIYFEYKLKYGYKRKDNLHYLNTTEKSVIAKKATTYLLFLNNIFIMSNTFSIISPPNTIDLRLNQRNLVHLELELH